MKIKTQLTTVGMTNSSAVNNELKEIIFNIDKAKIEKKIKRTTFIEVAILPLLIILVGVLIMSFTV